MPHLWRRTYSPIPSLSRPCPCIRRQNGGRIPSSNVWSFRSASKCREWPWSSMLRLCPSGRGYPGTGWSGRSAGQVQPGRVGITPEGGSQRESGCRVVSERHEKPHLPRGSDPLGLRDGSSLPGRYPKAFRMPFLRGPLRFCGQVLGRT